MKLVKILSKIFQQVIVAQNGGDALLLFKNALLNKEPFDVIISDINMPILDGIGFLEKVRKLDEQIPFIFVTAQLNLDSLLKIVKLDVNDYILKPIVIDDLLRSIKKVIKKNSKKDVLVNQKNRISLNKNLIWDSEKKTLFIDLNPIKLTKKEILVLDLLCVQINKIVDTELIIYEVWLDEIDVEKSNTNLKNLISRLRIKVPLLNIENIYGLGYRIKGEYIGKF